MVKKQSELKGLPGPQGPQSAESMKPIVVGSAKEAVCRMVGRQGGLEPAAGGMEEAIGALVLSAAFALLEGMKGERGPVRKLLWEPPGRRNGKQVAAALGESANRVPPFLGGPFARSVEFLSGGDYPERHSLPLLDFLRTFSKAVESLSEWEALRMLGDMYEASLAWEVTARGIRQSSERVKAMGAVYTPGPVVGLIVKRTLGPLLEGRLSPDRLDMTTVCDPACGGGAFLLEAMRLMEDEAVRRGRGASKVQGRLGWRRRLASRSLYGVDLDASAADLTRLALWVASGGCEEAADALSRNIRRGDALVGAWLADLPVPGVVEIDRFALRSSMDSWCGTYFSSGAGPPAVHWELDFPDRFPGKGAAPRGWDVVVGNPPYVGSRSLKPMAAYLRARFPEIYTGYNDLSAFFFHRGLEILKPGGRLGFIGPSYWFQNTYGEKLRNHIMSEGRLEEVYDFGPSQVFPGRGVHAAAVVISKAGKKDDRSKSSRGGDVRYLSLSPREIEELDGDLFRKTVRVPRSSLADVRWVFATGKEGSIMEKVFRAGVPLGEMFHVEKGPTSGCNGVFTLSREELQKQNIEVELLRPCIKNSDVRRYGPLNPDRWLLYLDGSVELELYPNAAAYLESHRQRLDSRNESRRGLHPWWRLERPRGRTVPEAPAKLVVPYRAPLNRFTMDEAGCLNDGGDVRFLVPREGVGRGMMLSALAIANSAVGNLVYRLMGKPKGRMLEYFVKPLASVPLGPPAELWKRGAEEELARVLEAEGPEALALFLSRKEEALIVPALALLAERMLALHKDGSGPEAKAALDSAIDSLVARLFGLTDAEEALAAQSVLPQRASS